MADQYIYNRFGRVIGRISDKPPQEDKGCVFGCLVPLALVAVMLLLLLSAC